MAKDYIEFVATLIKDGDSYLVKLPQKVLRKAKLTHVVDVRVEGRSIVISSVTPSNKPAKRR